MRLSGRRHTSEVNCRRKAEMPSGFAVPARFGVVALLQRQQLQSPMSERLSATTQSAVAMGAPVSTFFVFDSRSRAP